MTATTRFGFLGGGLLTAIGALGFATTGLRHPTAGATQHLWIMEVTPVLDLIHVVPGVTLVLGGAAAAGAARTTSVVGSAALGTLAVVGLALGAGTPIAPDAWGTALHLALAAWGTAATVRHHHRAAGTRTTVPRHP